jgi:hypothetical protein
MEHQNPIRLHKNITKYNLHQSQNQLMNFIKTIAPIVQTYFNKIHSNSSSSNQKDNNFLIYSLLQLNMVV